MVCHFFLNSQDKMRYATDAKLKKQYGDELALLTPIVKAFLSETGFEIVNDGLQVYGGVPSIVSRFHGFQGRLYAKAGPTFQIKSPMGTGLYGNQKRLQEGGGKPRPPSFPPKWGGGPTPSLAPKFWGFWKKYLVWFTLSHNNLKTSTWQSTWQQRVFETKVWVKFLRF